MRPAHLTRAERSLSHLVSDFAMGKPSPEADCRAKLIASRDRLMRARRAADLAIGMVALGLARLEVEAAAKAHRDLMAKVFTQ